MTATKVRLFMTGSVACMLVGTLESIARERTDATAPDIAKLEALVDSWELLADLAQSDLVLWLPTWNSSGYVAAAMVRPTTASTMVPEDIVGTFMARGRLPEVDRARTAGLVGDPQAPSAVAVRGDGRRVIGIIARKSGPVASGLLQQVYSSLAGVLFAMVERGEFPPAGASAETSAGQAPRVGDGLIVLDVEGRVERASPNAVSALRRMGLAADPVGTDLARTITRLTRRLGPVDAGLTPVVSGRRAGMVEVEGNQGSLVISATPLVESGQQQGAIILLRDVTDLRTRDRALLSKDAALREAHHRVKNNLQTVAALLRLQSRRVQQPEARSALTEAGRRIGAIAAVHDILAVTPGAQVALDEFLQRLVDLSRQVTAPTAGAGPQIVVESHVDDGGLELGSIPSDIAGPVAMAVSELLANALEHAQATTVRISAGRHRAGEQGVDRLTLQVSDDGVGMSTQATPGLGLQIVRSLIEEDLQGSVELESGQAGTTATIEVNLPHQDDSGGG